MSFNVDNSEKPKQTSRPKNQYYAIAMICAMLILLMSAGILLLQSGLHAPKQQALAMTPTLTVSTTKTTNATPSPRPGTPTATPQVTATPQTTATPVVTSVATTATVGATLRATPTSAAVGGSVPAAGSLLLGTNMSLNDSSDQMLNSPATLAMMQKMHVGIVRIPMRTTLSEQTMIAAARAVRSIGASALVILERPEAGIANAVANDTQVIKDMNTVFGGGIVYYEYGNEPNLAGFPGGTGDPTPYVASWNKNIPLLKAVAANGRFVGPAMYQYVASYLQGFLQGAKPLPDFVSWHEYTCSVSSPASYCLQHIDNWAIHDSSARAVMNATIGSSLPIIISEWNYTPAYSVVGDGKGDNAAFMTQWTTLALQSLISNGIYAAMQYSCTNTQLPLIDVNSAATTQGSIFLKSAGG